MHEKLKNNQEQPGKGPPPGTSTVKIEKLHLNTIQLLPLATPFLEKCNRQNFRAIFKIHLKKEKNPSYLTP